MCACVGVFAGGRECALGGGMSLLLVFSTFVLVLCALVRGWIV